MKKLVLILLVLVGYSCIAQNAEDAYKDNTGIRVWPSNTYIPIYYEGEYQIFLDKLYWRIQDEYEAATISLGIEVVSFPFIPDNFPNKSGIKSHQRNLNTAVASNYDHYGFMTSPGHSSFNDYAGIGWEYGGYTIFQKLFNVNSCNQSDDKECDGYYALVSADYWTMTNFYQRCLLPHTVLKHTVYFHCGSTISSDVIDSISWLYDNTRGAMSTYPFFIPNSSDSISKDDLLINPDIDVTFRPTFHDYPNGWIPYNDQLQSNEYYYDSGLKDDNGYSISTGSADYFPSSIGFMNYNICSTFPFYFDSENPPTGVMALVSEHYKDNFTSSFVHPPPYALFDSPLLGCKLQHYAGYGMSGERLPGIEHTYAVDEAFNLTTINSKEKIIYNPSKVSISCNLTFPCDYRFLTLHGKYPDKDHEVLHGDYSKEYWDTIDDFEFEYDKDYPIPVNCTTNSSCKSEYILDGGITLTFQPPIIIMDAHFRGTSTTNKTTIHYNPNRTYGNWTYDTASIELDSNIATLPVCTNVDPNIDSVGNKTAFNRNSIVLEPGNHLKVLNGLTQHPYIQVNLERIQNARIRVFDSMGNLKQTEIIVSNKKSVDCSLLKPGIYHAVLINNGEVIDKISFGKK